MATGWVKKYKQKGGRYSGNKLSNSLHKWTKQNWRTRSGRPSIIGRKATGERYLPEKIINSISRKDYDYTSRLKRQSMKKGKQYSRQPKKIRRLMSLV